jgi:hypothetical protein
MQAFQNTLIFSEFWMDCGFNFGTMIFVMTVLEVQTNGFFDTAARLWRNGKMLMGATAAGAALLAGGGCTQTILTAPQRSATEQLLLSTAADRAMTSTNFSLFNGKKVFLDASNLDSYDSKYAIGSIRDALSRSGALLVRNETNSDIVIEARSGALSIDAATTLIGVPGAGVPVPLAGAVSIPELALFKSQKQFSLAKLALLAYETHGGKHIYSSGPMIGKAYNHYYRFLGFITCTSTDIPAKHRSTVVK